MTKEDMHYWKVTRGKAYPDMDWLDYIYTYLGPGIGTAFHIQDLENNI